MENPKKPIVLCFSGLDPTGGAGIQADIEAIAKHGCHVAPIITANTIQNTRNVIEFEGINPNFIYKQAKTILEDMPVSTIKIGMLGSKETTEIIHKLLCEHPNIPLIFDPVLSAGGGTSLARDNLIDAINKLIIPRTTILTPNIPEALLLSDKSDSAEQAALNLNKSGAKNVLLTGTHSDSTDVSHTLFQQNKAIQTYHYKRLPHEYHGSGCTLASSIAAFIALKSSPADACKHALDFTYKTLVHAQALGQHQLIPNRCH